jgi:hypothetical protein
VGNGLGDVGSAGKGEGEGMGENMGETGACAANQASILALIPCPEPSLGIGWPLGRSVSTPLPSMTAIVLSELSKISSVQGERADDVPSVPSTTKSDN